MRRGTRVLVRWVDIQTASHSEEDIEPIEAETVGWIESDTRAFLRVRTSRYTHSDFRKLADKIVIPKGCITSVEEI